MSPAFQQRGIGGGLMRACMIDARNSGFCALTLTTFRDVAWNAPFYSRLGFFEVATNGNTLGWRRTWHARPNTACRPKAVAR